MVSCLLDMDANKNLKKFKKKKENIFIYFI